MPQLSLKPTDRFNLQLPADPELSNERRQVKGACFSFVEPRIPTKPTLIHASNEVAALIGLPKHELENQDFVDVFSGAKVLPGTKPYAMCYGGHQFGHWAGQLGDGRAINLTEVTHAGETWALQLKGAGETPYSRSADGLAVLRSSIREHLCSEAMFHLGVPTSRSLSLMLTGDQVLRDMLYDGNPAYEKGAVVCRVARSFIRFGSFEILTANQDLDTLKALADFTIQHHFPGIEVGTKASYSEFFKSVCQLSLKLVIHWQRVGFVHGVMNTDNMSILGDTIDYGPYGWLEAYDHDWTPNTTDRQHRRYRYGQQAEIMFWNLHKLANALYPLVNEQEPLLEGLRQFQADYQVQIHEMHLAKLGLTGNEAGDKQLVADLQAVLQLTETDMTIFFRQLSLVKKATPAGQEFPESSPLRAAFYAPEELAGEVLDAWQSWLARYIKRLSTEARTDEQRRLAMNAVNPKYVLRNYMAQLAIDAADQGDYSLIVELYELLLKPYDEQPTLEKWFAKRPDWARNKVGCSMLSCSS